MLIRQTQTHGTGRHAPRKMNSPDLSTRLKLMGVDVASFGDFFADMRLPKAPTEDGEVHVAKLKPSKRHGANLDGPVKCLTYHDPFSATYKKYIFTEDGQYLLGGMMIGDVSSFTKLVATTKSKVRRCGGNECSADVTEKAGSATVRIHTGSEERGRRERG